MQKQVRRALGDVMNIKQQNIQQIINQKAQPSPVNFFKPILKSKERVEQMTEQVEEEIEFGGHYKYEDTFDDILNEKNKLSHLFLNAKSIPLLPTHSVGEISELEDTFHTEHIINDKEFKKNLKKQGK